MSNVNAAEATHSEMSVAPVDLFAATSDRQKRCPPDKASEVRCAILAGWQPSMNLQFAIRSTSGAFAKVFPGKD